MGPRKSVRAAQHARETGDKRAKESNKNKSIEIKEDGMLSLLLMDFFHLVPAPVARFWLFIDPFSPPTMDTRDMTLSFTTYI